MRHGLGTSLHHVYTHSISHEPQNISTLGQRDAIACINTAVGNSGDTLAADIEEETLQNASGFELHGE